MLIGILKNQNPDSADPWVKACEKKKVAYRVIDLTSNNWIYEIQSENFNLLLSRPPDDIERFKILYDERIFILAKVLNIPVYPSYEECLIYENKKLLSYYLAANNISTPKTYVFYNFNEASYFINNTAFPIVAKNSIGSAGSGIQIIRSKEHCSKYITKAFRGGGIRRRFGPNRVTGSPSKWLVKAVKDPAYFKMKFISYIDLYKDAQDGFVIFQEYIPHDFEWRVVRIGESYFAYKKLKVGDKTSGAKSLSFENPPLAMLDFILEISGKLSITCAAFDLFVTDKGFLINEIQTLFGHKNDHILEFDGKPGRYIYLSGRWKFEAGDFNSNESFDLRLQSALKLFNIKS